MRESVEMKDATHTCGSETAVAVVLGVFEGVTRTAAKKRARFRLTRRERDGKERRGGCLAKRTGQSGEAEGVAVVVAVAQTKRERAASRANMSTANVGIGMDMGKRIGRTLGGEGER